MKAPFIEKVFARRVVTDSGCWESTYRPARNGYTLVTIDGRPGNYLHRWAYSTLVGPIPARHEVMHQCDNPRCWNPAHLRVGTHADNMRDMAAKGRRKGIQAVPRQEVCKNGHDLLNDSNVRSLPNGKRRCRPCAVSYLRNWRKKRRGV